jgi:hypothetical protein
MSEELCTHPFGLGKVQGKLLRGSVSSYSDCALHYAGLLCKAELSLENSSDYAGSKRRERGFADVDVEGCLRWEGPEQADALCGHSITASSGNPIFPARTALLSYHLRHISKQTFVTPAHPQARNSVENTRHTLWVCEDGKRSDICR